MSIREDQERGIFVMRVIAVVFLTLAAAFVFKVWNERQMTHAYDRQAAALERIADSVQIVVRVTDTKKTVSVQCRLNP